MGLGLGLDCRVRVRAGFSYTVLCCRKCTQGETRPLCMTSHHMVIASHAVAPTCDPPWILLDTVCLLTVMMKNVRWPDAQSYCKETFNGRLAVLTEPDDQGVKFSEQTGNFIKFH